MATYTKIVDMSDRSIDFIWAVLLRDYEGEKKYVKRVFAITSYGGANILWQVVSDTTFFTLSTGIQATKKVTSAIHVPVYKHYVLTDEGLHYCREQMTIACL